MTFQDSKASDDSPYGSRPGTGSRPSTSGADNGTSKTSTRKKKSKIPLSIEDIFNKPSTVTASNMNPLPSRVVLTPRSAEVCLKLGVNPEVLKIRDIDSFWEPDIDPSVQRMRHEAYVQRRYEVMRQCRLEWKKMSNAEFDVTPTTVGLSPDKILKQQEEQNATIIEMEKKRIEKMKQRQERELEQMLQFEVNRAKIQHDMDKRLQENKRKEDIRKKQQEKRLKLVTEERRLRELQKLALEEAEEAKSRAISKVMYEREQKAIEEHKKKEEQDRLYAKEQDAERRRKQEEHKMQVQRFFMEEQIRLRARLETMNEAEQRKEKAIADAQEAKRQELETKRAAVEQRIARNMEMAKAAEEKRKYDFLNKQEIHESIRAQHLAAQEQERQMLQQEQAMLEQRRRMIILQQRKEEENNKHEMLKKFEDDEQHVQEVKEAHEYQMQLQKEKKKLQIQMKAENVERVKRMGEYGRLTTLKKIEKNEERINNLIETRKTLVEQRKVQSLRAKLEKDKINKIMEEVRSDATKANKIINMALQGKVSLNAISTASPQRSISSDGKKKKSSSSKTVGSSNSSGHDNSNDIGGGGRSHSAPGQKDSHQPARFKMDDGLQNPLPYISPYDTSDSNAAPLRSKITL